MKPPRMTRASFRIKSSIAKKHLLRALVDIRAGRYLMAFGFAKSSYKLIPTSAAAEVAGRAACLGRLRGRALWAYRKLRGARKRRVAVMCSARGIDLR